MSTVFTTCPKCGGTYFYRRYNCAGTWLQLIRIKDGMEEIEDSSTDGVTFRAEPKYVICGDCKTRIPNPRRKTN